MPDTPRTWQLLTAMQASMALILQANGYYTDAGAYVTLEPTQIPDGEPALVALVLENLGRATDPALARRGRLATVVAIIKVPTVGDDRQIRLHEAIQDVERCFDAQQGRFAVGLQWPQFVDSKVIPPVDGLGWIGAEVRFQSHVTLR